MKKKILVTDNVHSKLLSGLERLDFIVDYMPNIPLDETKKIIHHYEGIIVNTKTTMNREVLDLAKKLKFIARLGSGLDMIDLNYAEERDIEVIRSPEGNSNAVAEHALGMLLSLTNNLNRSNREIRKGEWNREKNRGVEIRNKTLGIIGFGHAGKAFSKVVSGLGLQIQYYDPYRKRLHTDDVTIKDIGLKELVSTSDIISFHVPLTKETNNMCNQELLNSCKTGAIIINTSRGKVVNLGDLVIALNSKQLFGACLDVFANEKVKSYTKAEKHTFKALSQMDNIVMSPHIAGWTKESKIKIANVLLQKIELLPLVGM